MEDTADAAGLSVDETNCVLQMSRQPLSLDQPVGDHDDSYFGEFLEDYREDDPLYEMNQDSLKDRIADVLGALNYREREIIRLRYGLADGYSASCNTRSARTSFPVSWTARYRFQP